MKVLVTGASGRLGPTVCRVLAASGHDVLGTDIRGPRRLETPFELADLQEPGRVLALLAGCDALVHLGNIASDLHAKDKGQVYITNNAINIRTFEAALEAGTRCVVFASSIQAVSGRRKLGQTEQPSTPAYLPADGGLPINARSPYGLSKAAGEQVLAYLHQRDANRSLIAIRFPLLARPQRPATWQGPGRSERFGPERDHSVDELFSYLDMDDAAALVLRAVEQQPPGLHTLFPASSRTLGGESPQDLIARHYADVPLRKPLDQISSLIDNTPITDLLGWEPVY